MLTSVRGVLVNVKEHQTRKDAQDIPVTVRREAPPHKEYSMKQASVIFNYHSQSYDLVKYDQGEMAYWRVYSYSIQGRGIQVAEFTDVKFNLDQAQHVAKHLLRMYRLGKEDGRKEIKKDLRDLVDTDTV